MGFSTAARKVLDDILGRPRKPTRDDIEYKRAIGDRAQALIDSDPIAQAFSEVGLYYLDKMSVTRPTETDEREYWHRRWLGLQDVMHALQDMVAEKDEIVARQDHALRDRQQEIVE